MSDEPYRPREGTETVRLDRRPRAADGGAPSRPIPVLSPGTRVGGRYVVERVLGHGGFAVVYRARDLQGAGGPEEGPVVALKDAAAVLADLERQRRVVGTKPAGVDDLRLPSGEGPVAEGGG